MANTISNMDDTIDSRDVIERIEELQTELEEYHDEQATTLSFEYALQDAANFPEHAEEYAELTALLALQEEAEGYCPDWTYGAQLIRDSYFEQAMDEMIEDCYGEQYSKDLPSFMTITLDYAALQSDYTSVDFDGITYWVR